MDRTPARRLPLLPSAAGDVEVRPPPPPPRLAQTFIHAHSCRGGKPAPPRRADAQTGKRGSGGACQSATAGGDGPSAAAVGLEGDGVGAAPRRDGPSQRRYPKRARSLSARGAQAAAALAGEEEEEARVAKVRKGKGKAKAKEERELGEQADGRVLKLLPDHLAPDLDILVVGINPGLTSSATGHHFAHFSNHFWPALHQSGLTPTKLLPSAGPSLLVQEAPYLRIGLTNLCPRPTRDAAGLKAQDYTAGAPLLIRKVAQCRPAVAVMVGKGIAQIFERATRETLGSRHWVRVPASTPLAADESGLGLQPFAIAGYGDSDAEADIPTLGGDEKAPDAAPPPSHITLCFCVPSTSGRVTTHQLPGKVEWFGKLRALAEAVAQRKKAAEEGDWIDVEVRVLAAPDSVETVDDEAQAELSDDKAEAILAVAQGEGELQAKASLDEKPDAEHEQPIPLADAQASSQVKQETS